MEAISLDGKKLSADIKADLAGRVQVLKQKGITPSLATILVGSDPASETYVKMKGKACEAVGMISRRIEMPQSTTTDQLTAKIRELNEDSSVQGILLQHPVPHGIDERLAFDTILPEKDVDGVTTMGFGRVSFGLDAYACCTPAGIVRLLDAYNVPMEGRHAVIVGRSPILGKPLAFMLLNRNCTVTICHSKTKDLPAILAAADIVVGALGKPQFIKGEWLKEGVVVVDAGYNKGNVGDCDFDSCAAKASHITPVPGGVGPMTIAMLLEHTVKAAEKLR